MCRIGDEEETMLLQTELEAMKNSRRTDPMFILQGSCYPILNIPLCIIGRVKYIGN